MCKIVVTKLIAGNIKQRITTASIPVSLYFEFDLFT